MIKLLFTAGGSPGQEAIYRFLNLKYDLYFCDSNIANISPNIPPSRRISVPRANTREYEKTIVKLCNELAIDLLIPGVDEELLQLYALSSHFENTFISAGKKNLFSLCSQNHRWLARFRKTKISIPRTYPITSAAPLSNEKLVVIKPDYGRGSRDVFSNIEAGKARALVEAFGDASKLWVVREQIFGDEYTVQMISSPNSKLVAIIPIKVLRNVEALLLLQQIMIMR